MLRKQDQHNEPLVTRGKHKRNYIFVCSLRVTVVSSFKGFLCASASLR